MPGSWGCSTARSWRRRRFNSGADSPKSRLPVPREQTSWKTKSKDNEMNWHRKNQVGYVQIYTDFTVSKAADEDGRKGCSAELMSSSFSALCEHTLQQSRRERLRRKHVRLHDRRIFVGNNCDELLRRRFHITLLPANFYHAVHSSVDRVILESSLAAARQ